MREVTKGPKGPFSFGVMMETEIYRVKILTSLLTNLITTVKGPRRIVVLKEKAPEWVIDMVREAHGTDILPDDFRFIKIRQVLHCLMDTEAFSHECWESCEDVWRMPSELTSIYNTELTTWLASHLSRIGQVDEAMDDHDRSASDLIHMLSVGQEYEIQGILNRLIEAIDERVETLTLADSL